MGWTKYDVMKLYSRHLKFSRNYLMYKMENIMIIYVLIMIIKIIYENTANLVADKSID